MATARPAAAEEWPEEWEEAAAEAEEEAAAEAEEEAEEEEAAASAPPPRPQSMCRCMEGGRVPPEHRRSCLLWFLNASIFR